MKYRIAMTCSGGTIIAGDYEAKTAAGATSKARAEHGDEWTYYLFKKLEDEISPEDEIVRLRDGIRNFIVDNSHLADGDNCTLKALKDLINFEFSEVF